MNLIKQNIHSFGNVILAIPLFLAGSIFLLGVIISTTKLFKSGLGSGFNISLVEGLSLNLIPLMIGLMSVIGAYRLATKKERIFPKWFIVAFSVFVIFGTIFAIVTTKDYTLIGFIIGISFFYYQKFLKNRNKNRVIDTNKYFR